MEIKSLNKKAHMLLQKYKYVILIVVVGIVLMLLPTEKKKTNTVTQSVSTATVNEEQLQTKLVSILEQIDGVGKVRVLLTSGKGEETIYQTNVDENRSETDKSYRSDTVLITNSDKNQLGLVKQVNPPTYLGAIIVCQGADDPVVRLKVIDAVSKATGLGASSISVSKMK